MKSYDAVPVAGSGAIRELGLLLVSLPLYVLGYLAGMTVRCALWMTAAIVAGYKAGANAE